MRLSELLTIVADEITVYEEDCDGEFVDLYVGKCDKVPKELSKREVRYIGCGRRCRVDICLTQN